jgi:hypothetical protein
MMIIKPYNTEITVSAANTVYDAPLVRVYASANTLITIEDTSANTTISTFTMSGNTVEIVEKIKTHSISGNTSILCVPVSYKS